MTDREDRLRSLLDKVRAKRPEPRQPQAAGVLERIRTASGSVPAVHAAATTPPPPASAPSEVASSGPSSHPELEPPTSPQVESPTRYSSQPPRVERPLSVEPRARSVRPSSGAPRGPSSGAPRPSSASPSPTRPDSIRAQSVQPTGQPIVYTTDEPEYPRPKTFGDLLELTLSLRPR